MGPFALHQERPRHASGLKSSTSLDSSLLAPTLSLDRLEHYWLTGETALGFLAGYYACAEKLDRLPGVAGQVAKSRSIDPTPPLTPPPKDPSR